MEPTKSSAYSLQTRVGLYRSVKDTTLKTQTIQRIANQILSGSQGLDRLTAEARRLYQAQEEAFRAAGSPDNPDRKDPAHAGYYAAYDTYKAVKAGFPCPTFSGVFEDRTDATMTAHSGLVGVDLDHLARHGLDPEAVMEACARKGFTALAFISPSGDGVKPFALVDPAPTTDAEHRRAWEQVVQAYSGVAPADVSDPKARNPSRLCFLAHDPGAHVAPPSSLIPLVVDLSEPVDPHPPGAGSTAGSAGSDATDILFAEFLRHPDVVKRPRSGPGEAEAWCPWHPDREGGKPSLKINLGKRIVKCFSAACGRGGTQALAEAWGITTDRPSPGDRREIEAVYDYRNAQGELRFQVVRYRNPKSFLQRQPDPARPGEYLWHIKGIQRVLYRLPDLRRADPGQWVWVVEGEKDVERLVSLGLVATTAPMGAGKGKWLHTYTREFRGRQVAVVPDNDEGGVDHAVTVAQAVSTAAKVVTVIHLPDLPERGDVSDYLDMGHTVGDLEDLLAAALPFEAASDPVDLEPEKPDWKTSPLLGDAVKLTSLLIGHGYFVNGGGAGSYYFDQDQRQLVYLDEDDQDLRILLGERYQINRKDQLYSYLLEHMLREAHVRGRQSTVRQFSHYDLERNLAFLDMGAGRVLRISPVAIEVRDNGADGVLFLPMPDQAPWTYEPPKGHRPLYERVIAKVNFTGEGSSFGVQHQRTLLLLWMLSMAFESMMPTKVLAVGIGPGGSGKTTLFRTCGQILIGPDFQVDSLLQDQKGEDDFWVNLYHSFMVVYDNVDQSIRWLPDALAQVSTGVRRSKRQLHTSSNLHRTKISCMLALTARTPTGSLRRDDVADRSLVFTLKRLETMRAEFEIQEEILKHRGELMSDYAGMVQKTLQVPLESVQVADPGMRMADFARVVSRIGQGLGPEMKEITDDAILRVASAQHRFTTEEDVLTTLLEVWITRGQSAAAGSMDVGEVPNEGRKILARDLLLELNGIAREMDLRFRPGTPEALGRQLENMKPALSERFAMEKVHRQRGNFWVFRTRGDDTPSVEQ